jgi:hypothetical protein
MRAEAFLLAVRADRHHDAAVRRARLISDGLYGIDLK